MQNVPRAGATYFFSSWWRGPMGVGPRLDRFLCALCTNKRLSLRRRAAPGATESVRHAHAHCGEGQDPFSRLTHEIRCPVSTLPHKNATRRCRSF